MGYKHTHSPTCRKVVREWLRRRDLVKESGENMKKVKWGDINYERINKYFKEHFALSRSRRLTEIDSLGLGR